MESNFGKTLQPHDPLAAPIQGAGNETSLDTASVTPSTEGESSSEFHESRAAFHAPTNNEEFKKDYVGSKTLLPLYKKMIELASDMEEKKYYTKIYAHTRDYLEKLLGWATTQGNLELTNTNSTIGERRFVIPMEIEAEIAVLEAELSTVIGTEKAPSVIANRVRALIDKAEADSDLAARENRRRPKGLRTEEAPSLEK